MGSIIFQEMAEPQKYWTKDDFKEHVHKELNWSRIGSDGITQDGYPISDTDWCGVGGPYHWIFWSRERDDSDHLHCDFSLFPLRVSYVSWCITRFISISMDWFIYLFFDTLTFIFFVFFFFQIGSKMLFGN